MPDWHKINHPHQPDEAGYERRALQRRITEDGPQVVVSILKTYALMKPKQGSYAGSLWALAEWAQTQIDLHGDPILAAGEATSYPHLRLARLYGVDHGDVLSYADFVVGDDCLPTYWQQQAIDRLPAEVRAAVNKLINAQRAKWVHDQFNKEQK